MLYCIYLTIYRGTKLPIFYLGSTSVQKIENGYRGSVSSNEYKSIWLTELKTNPHLFTTKILSTYLTRKEAYNSEHRLHRLLKTHKNPLYTNKSIGGPMSSGIAWNKGLTLFDEKYKKGGKANKGKVKGPLPTSVKKKLSVPNSKKGHPGKLNPMYGVKRPEIMAVANAASVSITKGKTYEEIHGVERATQLKQDRSIKLKTYIKNTPGCRDGKNNAHAKSYKFIDPTGATHIIYGEFKTFCRAHKLEFGAAINCAKGRRASYKGWTIHYC